MHAMDRAFSRASKHLSSLHGIVVVQDSATTPSPASPDEMTFERRSISTKTTRRRLLHSAQPCRAVTSSGPRNLGTFYSYHVRASTPGHLPGHLST